MAERPFVHCFQIELQFSSVVEGGKPEKSWRKPHEASQEPTTRITIFSYTKKERKEEYNPLKYLCHGFEPKPHVRGEHLHNCAIPAPNEMI